MAQRGTQAEVERLRSQVEHRLQRAKPGVAVESLLERLLQLSEDGSDTALFAHQHLAELLFQRAPWRAALHLRQVLQLRPQDDVVLALMGLAQAVMGNFRTAIAMYRRAVAVQSHNPWYLHNLGHILDVALRQPEAGLPHLQQAHALCPEEHEIEASLAHCLGALGHQAEALLHIEAALQQAPRHREHLALRRWLLTGSGEPSFAPRKSRPETRRSSRGGTAVGHARVQQKAVHRRRLVHEASAQSQTVDDRVDAWLQQRGRQQAWPEAWQRSARALWHDARTALALDAPLHPVLWGAAVEYAVARLTDTRHVTQVVVAEAHDISARGLSRRYRQLRQALCLEPYDPRYLPARE
ncbi:MAG: hypothetical protein ACPGUV_06130 [Polyangiales bacterium]